MIENRNNKNNRLPLSFAPIFGCKDTSVRMKFLEELSDINAVDKNGMTIAMYGAMVGDIDVLQYCKEHSANFNIQKESGVTACILAVYFEQEMAVSWLLKNGNIDLSKKVKNGVSIFDFVKQCGTKKIQAMFYAEVKNLVAEKVKERQR